MGEELRDRVRERYAGVARSVREGEEASCCGSGVRALDSEAPGVDWTGGSYSEGEKEEYETLLRGAGFKDVSVEVTHAYEPGAAVGSDCCGGVEALRDVPLASAFIRGRKPVGV